jgi:hypothetical protein
VVSGGANAGRRRVRDPIFGVRYCTGEQGRVCMVELKLKPARVAFALFAGFSILLIAYAGVATARVQYPAFAMPFAELFDFDREGNISSWYNSTLFIIAAFASWLNFLHANQSDRRQRRHWQAIALIMLALSIDELVALHELLGAVTGLQSQFYFGWVIVVAPLAALLALSFIPFLLRLPRMIALILIVSGVIYLSGAVGLEIAAGKIVESIVQTPRPEMTPEHWALIARNPAYLLEVALEESFEQCGLIVFIYGALRHLSQSGAVLRAGFSTAT